MMGEEDEKAPIKQLADAVLPQLIDALGHMQDEAGATGRWIMASLVTINGGAALALLSAPSVTLYTKITAGRCFITGVVFALLLGYGTLLAILKLTPKIAELINCWRSTTIIDTYDDAKVQDAAASLLVLNKRWMWITHAMGLVSLIAFVAGAWQIGINLK